MYSQERELKKRRGRVCNKARVEERIAEAFVHKEIMNLSSTYLSHANNVDAHTTQYHIVKESTWESEEFLRSDHQDFALP
jgi:hypothetical protein